MKRYWRSLISVVVAVAFLSACASATRYSTWDSPKAFTKDQVFNAAVQAGGLIGMKPLLSDRQSGALAFVKGIAKGEMNLSVQLVEANGIIKVRTTGNHHGNIPVEQFREDLNEEVIRNFHLYLFRVLKISPSEISNVTISK